MRGDKSPPTISTNHYNKLLSIGTERHMGRSLQYSALHECRDSACRSGAIAALSKKSPPPKPIKNFPQEHPPKTKRIKSSLCKGGCSWGKFGVGQGGLEGRETPPKGVSLRLQGLPHPSPLTPTHHLASRAGGEGVEKKRAAGGETNAQTRVTAFPNPPRHPPERRRA